jgi:integrase
VKPQKRKPAKPAALDAWQKTPFANLVRYVPSGKYFARIRVRGKLIRQSLKTKVLSVAKLRLADLEKAERLLAENATAVAGGKITVGDALKTYRTRLHGDGSLKPRTKAYREECISKLLRTWPRLVATDVRLVNKTACLDWAARLGEEACPSVFNHTVGTLRCILEMAIETGALYDNPVRFIKRQRERPKRLHLPTQIQFRQFVETIRTAGVCSCYQAADLVQFLAFGGFRKSEARNIIWADCDFTRQEITVKGDPETGTKNNQTRVVPMIPEMVELLARLRTQQESVEPDARVMRIGECQTSMDRAANLVGMPRITHHDLRHLFATRCIESGVDIPTVSRWLGHMDGGALAMKVYGHLRDQHSSEMARKVSFS